MEILTKALKKGKIEPTMQAFPFRDLGTTYEYVKTKTKYAEIVANRVKEHLDTFDNNSAYTTRLENIYYNSTSNDFYNLNITIDMIDSDSINVHCTDKVITFYG